jgi:hypothetical protein
MKFQLNEKCGAHVIDGKTYWPGDYLESDVDLVEKFPGKFTRVSSGEEVASGEESRVSAPAAPTSGLNVAAGKPALGKPSLSQGSSKGKR